MKCILQGFRAEGQGLGNKTGGAACREGTGTRCCGCHLESSRPHISEWDGSPPEGCCPALPPSVRSSGLTLHPGSGPAASGEPGVYKPMRRRARPPARRPLQADGRRPRWVGAPELSPARVLSGPL